MNRLTPEQAIARIKQYCAYQERCHREVKDKLYSFGLNHSDVEIITSLMIAENYLNEERFAVQYAGGKFRMNKWGKVRIKHALKQKGVSEYSIKKGLSAIPDDDYLKTARRLFTEKSKSLKSEKNIFIKKRKVRDYLIQKGFENELVSEMINS